MVFSGLSALVIGAVEDAGEVICVWARTRNLAVACPGCGMETSRVHGYHERAVADVPVDGRRVLVRVKVCRMRCPIEGRLRQTFRKQVPGVLERYQRRHHAAGRPGQRGIPRISRPGRGPAARHLEAKGHTVGVFSHHIDSITLSDQLQQSGVDHEIIGLPESVTTVLDAQHAMIAFAGGTVDWDLVPSRLAVSVTSTEHGSRAPELAHMIISARTPPAVLARELDQLRLELSDSSITAAASLASRAHKMLGLTRG